MSGLGLSNGSVGYRLASELQATCLLPVRSYFLETLIFTQSVSDSGVTVHLKIRKGDEYITGFQGQVVCVSVPGT